MANTFTIYTCILETLRVHNSFSENVYKFKQNPRLGNLASHLWACVESCGKVLGHLACENIRFSTLFAARDVSGETSLAAKSEEKRMFSQAIGHFLWVEQ